MRIKDYLTAEKPIEIKECDYCGNNRINLVQEISTLKSFCECPFCKSRGPLCDNATNALEMWNNKKD